MMLNYGLTFASKGQDKLLKEMDELLEHCCSFSVQKEEEKKGALDLTMMEQICRAYWTKLAPNVEDYSTKATKLIVAGSGQLVKGILWCGDITVDRLIKGNEILKLKIGPASNTTINPELLKAIHRVNKVTKMTETVVGGLLSGVLKITGFFTSSVASSKLGKKFFKFLPGEIALATLDGFSKIYDAFEVSGKNIMSTSSTVTTELVSHKTLVKETKSLLFEAFYHPFRDMIEIVANRLRSMVVAEVPKLASAAEYFFKMGVEGKSVASLLHDDVLDDADTTHEIGCLNFVMGNKLAVLAGYFLLFRACITLASLKNTELL
ncbi:hypothetical protein Lser_V15G14203 [Lactuca serriola]